MQRKSPFAEGEFYHLYNRGNDRRSIFVDERDKIRFMKLLYVCNSKRQIIFKEFDDFSFSQLTEKFKNESPLVAIGAYCLMPNHFHFLVKEIKENGISVFMQKFSTAYSMYFNKKNKRTGALFEGRFRSSHVKNDNYLKYLFAYIHLNPIKLIDSSWRQEGIQDIERAECFLAGYPYSSFFEYIGKKRPEQAILSQRQGEFPEYFETHTEFKDFIRDWMEYDEIGDVSIEDIGKLTARVV